MRRWVQVVVVLSALLMAAGLLAVWVSKAQHAAARAMCRNNLRQVGAALDSYESVYGAFPRATMPSFELPVERRPSWLYELDPFIHARMDPEWHKHGDKPWDSSEYLRTASSKTPMYRCPEFGAEATADGWAVTTYVGSTGVGSDAIHWPRGDKRAGVFGLDRKVKHSDITDGSANTALVIETSTDVGPWVAGGRPTARGLDPTDTPPIGAARPFGGLHAGGCMVLYADGSIRFLSAAVNPDTLAAQFTIAAGDTVDLTQSESLYVPGP